MKSLRHPHPTPTEGRDRLLTPGTYDKVVLSRQDSQHEDAEDFESVREVLTSKPFLTTLFVNTLVTFLANILFSWGTLSTWGANHVSPIYLFRPIQPAGDKGASTSMAIDMAISTFAVAFMNCLATWERTDDADLGKLGRLRPELVSKGMWRFAPKGSNWTRAFVTALMFCTFFCGASIAFLALLWVGGAGGEWMEVEGWAYIFPKAVFCALECMAVFTISYVVALSRCARSQRDATQQRMRESAVLCTKIINWLQLFGAVVIAGFSGYTYFFAFGGIQLGPLLGMWACAAFMFILSIRGLSRASSSLNRASGGDLVYFFFMFLTFVSMLVCSGFCLVYSEQGVFIIKDNWQKIKVGVLLPFTSEYDLQETVTINLQSTAGFGFGFSIVVLFGILHFTKRLGPGQNLILMVQALNFVLMCIGGFCCYLVNDVSVITSYGAADGALNMVMVLILGFVYVTVSIFVGSFVASGSRAPFNLAMYASFLLVLVVPTIYFASKLFQNAANAELYIYNRWDSIAQLLPADQPIWTKCSSQEVTRCKEGLTVTARANFQAVGWLAVAMASVGFLNGWLSISLRQWHIRYGVRQRTGRGETDAEEGGSEEYSRGGGGGGGDDDEESMKTPQRRGVNDHSGLASGGYRGGYGTVDPPSNSEQDTYHILDDSQSDALAPSPAVGGSMGGGSTLLEVEASTSTEPRSGPMARRRSRRTKSGKDNVRWSFISQTGLGLSLSTCLGHAPSSTLRLLRRWAVRHPFKTLVVGTALVTGITIAIAFTAYVVALRSSCAVVASHADNTTRAVRVATMAVPYGCLCQNIVTLAPAIWHPLTNQTCAPSLYSNFELQCQLLPRIESININHHFDYGSVVFTSQNATDAPNVTATLKLLGNKPSVSDQWLVNTSEWWSYNETTGSIDIDLTPPEGSTVKVLGYSVSCQSAALEFSLPMPFQDIQIFSLTAGDSTQKPFIYCVSAQSTPHSNGDSGCIDLSVTAKDVSISVFSNSDVALSDLGKNGSQSELFTSLMDEIPFGDIAITSGYGNLITESIFAVGAVALSTNQGNAIIKNSFAKNLDVLAMGGDVEGVDVAAFKNIEQILAALTPKSTVKLLATDFGHIAMQSDRGDCIATGIFACNSLDMITLENGNPVAATLEIIGTLNITAMNGDVYMTGVDSTSHVHVDIGTGNLHASAVVAESIDMVVGHGNVNIIELFLGNVFALIPGLFPGGSGNDKPFVTVHVDRGDITIEGMQGLKSPADSAELQVDLAAGGGGNIKLIVNANGFLGQFVCCLLFVVCCLLWRVVRHGFAPKASTDTSVCFSF